MKKKTKILIISILIIIAVIAIFSLVIYLYHKIGVNTSIFVNCYDGRIIKTANMVKKNASYKLDEVILKDLNLNEIDKNQVQIGDYIYLFIKNDNTYYYLDNTNYYCKVIGINNDSINVEITDWQFYSFNAENINIKDINGNQISTSDLKLGDKLRVINIVPEVIPAIAETFEGYSSSTIYDVKNIKIVGTDQETKEKLENRNMIAIKKAIIAGVNKDNLYVLDSENQNLLYEVAFSNEGNIGFKQGQEILIYFNGKGASSSKNGIIRIENVGKIEIINNNKENMNLISKETLKKFYTSFDNVEINIERLTNSGITLTITDNNSIKYEFANKYTIFRNIAEKSQVIITEDYMQIPGYSGDKWQEVTKISNDNESNIGSIEIINENTSRRTYNWKNTYGNLEMGEYKILLEDEDNNDFEKISIIFSIDKSGQIINYSINKGF